MSLVLQMYFIIIMLWKGLTVSQRCPLWLPNSPVTWGRHWVAWSRQLHRPGWVSAHCRKSDWTATLGCEVTAHRPALTARLHGSVQLWIPLVDTKRKNRRIYTCRVYISRCQRCLSRLVPRSAETPLVKGTVIFMWKIFVGWRHCLNVSRFQ